jgi:hypothetical protein
MKEVDKDLAFIKSACPVFIDEICIQSQMGHQLT